MTDETNAEVSEVGSVPSTEPSQSAEGAQAPEEKSAVEVQAQEQEPVKEAASTTEPAAEEPAKDEPSSLTLVERIEKIEQNHAALVKKLDEQYAIR